MIQWINSIAADWLDFYTVFFLQGALFTGLVLFVLRAFRHERASVLRLVALVGFLKLLVPPLYSFGPAEPLAAGVRQVVVLASGSLADSGAAARLSLAALLMIAWGSVAAALVAFTVVQYLRLRSIVRTARPVTLPGALTGEPHCRISVLLSGRDESPLVFGLFRHWILLPRSWNEWSEDRRRSVLAHELAHVRRNDHWVQLVRIVALSLHFFDPLVWVLSRRLEDYTELAADEDSIAGSRQTPAEYVSHLLGVAGDVSRAPRSFPARSAVTGSHAWMRRRIQYLLSDRPERSSRRTLATGLVVMALVAAVLPGSANYARSTGSGTASSVDVATAPVGGYEALGRRLTCPCPVRDHSVCPKGRIRRGAAAVHNMSVVVRITVDSDGRVLDTRVIDEELHSLDWWADEVLSAVRDTRWRPGMADGRPVRSDVDLVFVPGDFRR